MSLIKIPVANIDTAGRSLEAELPVAWLDEQLADDDNDLKGAAPGQVTARLSRSGTDVVVRGRVKASVRTPCARCLESTNIDVDTELSLLLKAAPGQAAQEPGEGRHSHGKRSHAAIKERGAAAGAAAAGAAAAGAAGKPGATAKKPAKESKDKDPPEYEFSSEEADLDTYDGETVVLDDFVREAILLEMPIFPLCSESCPGIRPSPEAGDGGDTRPVDPRLAPLGALRAGLEKAMSSPRGATAPADDDEGESSGTAGAPAQKKTTKKE
ncbi:YceD family protein [Polyangium aurulentum]|uniref:YceD family protein n=1 Tax=Polyangium aurulentum TaxID=2567896 RepID=UPI0010AEDC97|nr:DUF177 domain-containing protein [Polyangium aurulentum]UQA56058.1 DUF177 domain-containing protein [Polyangium aurulentum]